MTVIIMILGILALTGAIIGIWRLGYRWGSREARENAPWRPESCKKGVKSAR